MHSQGGSQDGAAATKIQRAVLVLSLGSRPFFKVTRPLIENFAARVSATLHVLSSVEHPALQPHMRRFVFQKQLLCTAWQYLTCAFDTFEATRD